MEYLADLKRIASAKGKIGAKISSGVGQCIGCAGCDSAKIDSTGTAVVSQSPHGIPDPLVGCPVETP